ncbi:MAG: catalase, partial [Pseudomonadota bacterium]|nr:catalase [Pseudomonadota bacterium]
GGNAATIDQLVAEMNQRIETITLAESKNGVIPRFNQAKSVACLSAQFRVHDKIPAELKQGLFSKAASYPAMLRFANATNRDDSKKDIRGLSIKVSNVDGKAVWGETGIQDFIFNSYPALFVATPEDFLSFIRARQEDKKLRFFLNPFDAHLKSLWIVFKAREKHLSPLDIRYWSTVPFRLGETGGQVVKYSVTPCSDYHTKKAVKAGKNQLRAAIKAHLQQGPACFDFSVQLRTDPHSMPIEDASVIWDEQESSFQRVATITIENQVFDTPKLLANCEHSSFNPWQSLAAHEPLGRMNEVRRSIYQSAAKLRNME